MPSNKLSKMYGRFGSYEKKLQCNLEDVKDGADVRGGYDANQAL